MRRRGKGKAREPTLEWEAELFKREAGLARTQYMVQSWAIPSIGFELSQSLSHAGVCSHDDLYIHKPTPNPFLSFPPLGVHSSPAPGEHPQGQGGAATLITPGLSYS